MIPEYIGDPFAFEQITVGVGATGLTAATYKQILLGALVTARSAVITADITTDFRHNGGVAGSTPTAAIGHQVDVSVDRAPIVLRTFSAIENFLAFGSGAVLNVTYYR